MNTNRQRIINLLDGSDTEDNVSVATAVSPRATKKKVLTNNGVQEKQKVIELLDDSSSDEDDYGERQTTCFAASARKSSAPSSPSHIHDNSCDDDDSSSSRDDGDEESLKISQRGKDLLLKVAANVSARKKAKEVPASNSSSRRIIASKDSSALVPVGNDGGNNSNGHAPTKVAPHSRRSISSGAEESSAAVTIMTNSTAAALLDIIVPPPSPPPSDDDSDGSLGSDILCSWNLKNNKNNHSSTSRTTCERKQTETPLLTSRKVPPSSSPPSTTWNCSACTFANTYSSTASSARDSQAICALCHMPRGRSVALSNFYASSNDDDDSALNFSPETAAPATATKKRKALSASSSSSTTMIATKVHSNRRMSSASSSTTNDNCNNTFESSTPALASTSNRNAVVVEVSSQEDFLRKMAAAKEDSSSTSTMPAPPTTPHSAVRRVHNPYASSSTRQACNAAAVTANRKERNQRRRHHQQQQRPQSRFSSSSSTPRWRQAATASTTIADHLDDDDDSDDDDDDLLKFHSGLTVKRAATTPSLARTGTSVTEPQQQHFVTTISNTAASGRQRQQTFPYPTLLSTSKTYPDERARFALAFWSYGQTLTRHAYQRPKLNTIAKRVVRLVACDENYPIRSLEEYICFGKSSVTNSRQMRDEIRQELDHNGVFHAIRTPHSSSNNNDNNAPRRFHTIAEACLVALLETVESRQQGRVERTPMEQQLKEKEMWASFQMLIPAIDRRLLPQSPGKLSRQQRGGSNSTGGTNDTINVGDTEAYYLNPSTRSMEFMQIRKLEGHIEEHGPWIKRHILGGKLYFELLPAGLASAMLIRDRPFPAPPGPYRRSKITSVQQAERQKYRGICLAIDLREGGGGTKVLHSLCNKLDMMKVPFLVGALSIGDYAFFTSKSGGKTMDCLDHLCPIIVERKSVQDVAQSIFDGRWKNQKRRMYHAQYVFGYNNSRMVYIIEGNENAQTVSGGYVGARLFNVDKEKLNAEVSNLEEEGFEVIRTPSKENTMFELARWARRVADELAAGTMKPKYTYAEFKQEVAKIPKQTDFSRLAKDHVQRKRAAEGALNERPSNDSSQKESDVELLSSPPASLPSMKRLKSTVDEKDQESDKYSNLSMKDLKQACATSGLAQSGKRTDLLARLRGPHPPKLWIERKRRGEYVPARVDTGATALLVALYLHEKDVVPGSHYEGMSKDELYVAAEGLNISKNPFSGGTTQTGPYHYDGWANMSRLKEGDPPLVTQKKGKFKLTRSCSISGFPIARECHKWCHEHGICPCED